MRVHLLAGITALVVSGASHADTAILGAVVHTMAGAIIVEDSVILIADGHVEAVGSAIDVPAGYAVVDAAGKVVTPGLIVSNSQLGIVEIGGAATTVDSRVTEHPLGAAFDIRYALNDAATAIAVNRRDGVTRAIVAPQPGNDPFAGWGVAIRLTDRDILTSVDVALFGAIGAATSGYVGGSRSAVVQRMRRGLAQAQRYQASRYHPGPGDFSHADMAALKRFRGAGVPLALEVHRANEIREAVALAEDFELDLIVLGATEAWRVGELLAARRIPVVIDVLANLPSSFERLGARLDNAALLSQAGVQVVFTVGVSQNARWLRQVAGNAVANGMDHAAALEAITRIPAQIWGLESGLGTLQPGAPADLVIWTGDPLEITQWAERVMIDGEWQDTNSRQTRLFERYKDLSTGNFGYR